MSAPSIDETRVAEILSLLGVSAPASATGSQMTARLVLALKQSGKASLLGADDNLNDAEAAQWISLSEQIAAGNEAFMKGQCKTLSTFLRTRSYLVGNRLSVADAAIFNILTRRNAPVSEFADLARYMDHISVLCTGKHLTAVVPPTVFPVAGSSASPAPTAAAPAEAPAAAAPAASSAKEEKKAGKKEKPAAAAAPAPAADKDEDELDPSKLDIRVGVITKCWEHPDSEKLYCEEIDLGEAAPRQIASGLRAFYPSVNDLTGRKVLVLANLKERALAGFKSNGMVLCASNEDHTQVKFVEVPASAKPGDRVVFPGFEGREPAAPNQMAKKKIFEKLAPQLRTNEVGVAQWADLPFLVGGEKCTAHLFNAHVA